MKKISLVLLMVGASFFVSCEKELDIKSELSLDANANISTGDVDKLLTGAYRAVIKPNSYNYFCVMATEIMADNYKPVKFQWFQVQYLYEKRTPASDILLSYYYKDYYTAISRANAILKVPSATNAQKGKARYVRALSLLRLHDLFEAVPITDENYNGAPIKPNTKQEVLQFVINDLLKAKESIEPFNTANANVVRTMPTKEAATALLARVYRMNGQIAEAGAQAEELITSGKFRISEKPKEYDGETIMKFAGNKAEESGSWGWIMSEDAKTWNCFAVADDLVALVKGDDTRKTLFDAPNAQGYVFSNKYTRDDDSDFIISRISEMYLISAEAGNTNRLAEFQAVRKSNLTLDEERRLELSFEWVRWSDLKLKGETYKLPYPQSAVDANPLLK